MLDVDPQQLGYTEHETPKDLKVAGLSLRFSSACLWSYVEGAP